MGITSGCVQSMFRCLRDHPILTLGMIQIETTAMELTPVYMLWVMSSPQRKLQNCSGS